VEWFDLIEFQKGLLSPENRKGWVPLLQNKRTPCVHSVTVKGDTYIHDTNNGL